ncbi:tRNA lysidine(34) synthetase TilS [Paenibacillus amylolyticus]|uniref:tRNA(Ile)-lysidine synthase n=1 Tax=Paenibacillus amylolyticus TaxID=1451 RepID=A0A1R1BGL6_PAEAM|nr:tRNA lysidine(34) synthetase TilS [Paenibacillus amylolyticus]OMF06154.1 tRNA lysidine(34) synthetase TilS [Paenibacillus amylolyticus]
MEALRWNMLVNNVLDAAEEHQLWVPGDRIVVAVSGGPDSVAFLHIMHEISKRHVPLELICAHVHHGFRSESDDEAEKMMELAQQLGIAFEWIKADVPSYMELTGQGPQEAARNKRYAFLHEVAAKYNAASIALAHHADDQAETVMLHLLRGTGLSGLAGMKFKRREKNVELIRPCLRINKTDLVEACNTQGFMYFNDESNALRKYRRNAIRLDVLPFLGQYNGQLTPSLNRLAEIVGDEDDFMEQSAYDTYRCLVQVNGGRQTFEVPSFLKLHVALQRRLIKLILNYLPLDSDFVDFTRIETIRRKVMETHVTTWSLDIGQTLACTREYNLISFGIRTDVQDQSYEYRLAQWSGTYELSLTQINRYIRLMPVSPEDYHVPESADQAAFDADQLLMPLVVRSRLPGDTMKVMGLNGSKKVKNIFIDEKIPPSVRPRIPVVCDGAGHIIWLPGVRRSNVAPVRDGTSAILYMTVGDSAIQG